MPDNATGRREFLRAAGAAAFTTSLFTGRLRGANDTVRLGFIGVGRVGAANIDCAARIPGCEIAAVCDAYQSALDRAWAQARALGFDGVRANRDFQTLLADKSIDAVCISTPDHWHAGMTVEACQAGKDVWVETPASVYVEEGARMLQAARKYNRVVQAGAMQRSGGRFQKAREIVKSGELGEIGFCRAFDELGAVGQGAMTGLPLLDLVQGAFDEAMPISISAQGGGLETPRAMLVTYRYPGFVASYESGGAGHGVLFHGSKATLMVNATGCFLFSAGAGAKPVEVAGGRTADSRAPHWRNFLECIRSRRRPAADIETCVRSTTTCLLSNIARWRGVTLDWDEKAFTVKQIEIQQYLKPKYRSPWELEV
jgi:predicted dehydrogenase